LPGDRARTLNSRPAKISISGKLYNGRRKLENSENSNNKRAHNTNPSRVKIISSSLV
jgi:hypothetical protein